MPQNERRPHLVVPVLLIVIGALFLYANYRPSFDPWPILRTYWPLILIFIGLGKLWDASRQRQNPDAPRGSSMGMTIAMVAFVFVLFALLWHGRAFSHDRRPPSGTHHEARSVERQGAQSVHASLESASGQLNVSGGSSHLFDGDFNYSGSYGGPRVDYSVSNGVGQLSVSQDGEDTHFVAVEHNEWNVRFGNDVPLELKIDLGAGQSKLQLRDIPITRLEVDIGAGQVDIDLTGTRKKDLDADIQGGVGQATIRLPKDVGAVARASGGIGTINARGLKHDDDEYTNDAYGKTPATIHLNVEGGVGTISLVQEP
jgi:hypothetical protein